LAHSLHSKLEPYFGKIVVELEKNMNETQGYDLILDTLVVLRRLFRSKGIDISNGGTSFHQNY
jgi:hypothetical protein